MKRLPRPRLYLLLLIAALLGTAIAWRAQCVDPRHEALKLVALTRDSGELICSPYLLAEQLKEVRQAFPEATIRVLRDERSLYAPSGHKGGMLIDDSWEPF